MACSKLNPTQTPTYNYAKMDEMLKQLRRVTRESSFVAMDEDLRQPYLTVARLPKYLTDCVPDWLNEDYMCNYIHVQSLLDPDCPFNWPLMSYQQYSLLKRWSKGDSEVRSWLNVFDDEYYPYATMKRDLVVSMEKDKNVLQKLHSVARNKTVAACMERKKKIEEVKRRLILEYQAFPNLSNVLAGSSNDTSVLSSIFGKIKDFFTNIIEAPVMAFNFAVKVKELFKSLIDILKGFVNFGRAVVSDYTQTLTQVALAFVYLVCLYLFDNKIARMLISLVSMVVMYSLNCNVGAVISAVIAGLNVPVAPPMVNNQITVNVSSRDRLELQSGDFDPVKIVALAFALLASLYCPFDSAWKAFLDKCDKIPKAINGLGKSMEYFEMFFKEHTEDFIEKATGYRFSSINPIPQEVRDNCAKVKDLAKMDTFSRMPSDVGICLQIEQVYIEFLRLKTQYYNNRLINEFLNAYQGSVIDLFKKASAANPRVCSERPRPTCIFFSGSTGVGKSSMMYLLTADILNHYKILDGKTPEEIMKLVNESIYARNAAQEFFDGYQNQLVTVVDDFGCMVDGPSHPNKDFEELLHMVNNFPYPLPMASLSQKANTYFTSKYVFLTSNLTMLDPTSMINPEAIRSRIAYQFDIRVKREYQVDPDSSRLEDHRIDTAKTRAAFGDEMTTDIYEIVVLDPVTGNELEVLSYDNMLERIVSHQGKERNFFDKKQESIMKHLRRNVVEAQGLFTYFGNTWFQHYYVRDVSGFYFLRRGVIDETAFSESILNHLRYEHKVAGPYHAERRKFLSRCTGDSKTLGSYLDYLIETQRDVANAVPEVLEDIMRREDWIQRLFDASVKLWNDDWDRIILPVAATLSYIGLVLLVPKIIGMFKDDTSVREEESGRSKNVSVTRSIESGKTKNIGLQRNIESGVEKKQRKTRQVETDLVLTTESGRQKRLQYIRPLESLESESFSSVQSMEVSKMVRTHFRSVKYSDNGKMIHVANIVGIRGHWCLINAHYINMFRSYGFNDDTVLTISMPDGDQGVEVYAKCFFDGRAVTRAGEQTDLWVFKTPKSVNMFGDLVKHFHTRAMMNDLAEKTAALLVVPGETFVVHSCNLDSKITSQFDMTNNGEYVRTIKCLVYEFDAKTTKGDCGSLYIVDTNTIRSKIVALHFAGRPSGGACGVPLVKEDFQFVYDDDFEVVLDGSIVVDPQCCVFPSKLDGIIPIGSATPVHGSIKSSIEKTSVHGKVQETTMLPAKLGRLLEPDGAGMKAIQKILPTIPILPDEELKMAKESFCENLWKGHPTTRRVFTAHEAITGLIPEKEPYIRAINRSTSAGYPWILMTSNGKKKMFDYDEKTAKWTILPDGQKVLDEVDNKISLMGRGVYKQSIYIDTLKDETRPTEKVLAGKTRLFSAAPVDFVILFRMYFLAFLNWTMVNKITNEIAVGICAQSSEWDKLARKLFRKGNNIVAGDFSNYDGTLNAQILRLTLDIINEWYQDEHSHYREMIFEDIIHSVHIAEKNVYAWTHSLPSGNPATAVVNSMYNSLACRIAYNRITKGTIYYGKFNKYVSMVSYGDDNLLSLDREIVEIVNQQSLTEAFASFGMTYTDETKSTAAEPYKTLEECGFLKRGFRYDSTINMWLGPLQQNSINERLNWQHKSPDPKAITMLNAEGAIAEWALHDDEEFEFWARKIKEVFLAEGDYIPVYSRSYYTAQLLDGSYNVAFPQLEFASAVVPQLLATTHKTNMEQNMDNLVNEQQTPTDNQTPLNSNPTNSTLVGNSQTDVSNTVRMTHEGQTISHVGEVTKEPSALLNTVNDPRFHQIKNFLERPYRVPEVTTWKAGNSYEQIFRIDIEKELMKMLAKLKVDGFYGFSGTCKLRVLANAQPFHTGLLQIAYRPKYEEFPTSTTMPNPMGGFYPTNMDTLVQARYESGFPSVLMNLGATSVAEIKVPYVGATSMMDLTPNQTMFGSFRACALVPIADSTNNASCGLSAYLSFEDVTLFATTPLSCGEKLEYQGGVAQIREAHQKSGDSDRKRPGTISKIAGTVSDVASALTAVPGLADIAGPVSWVAKGVGSVASMFGFSKPHSDKPSEPVWINPVKDFPLCEGVDHSTKLTVTPHSEIEVRSIGETSKDEMNLTHILAKPVYYGGLTWESSSGPSTLLGAIPVNPLSLRDQYPQATHSTRRVSSHTFVSYIANMFRYWMGSIRFTFTIVGNKFYSGRLRFVYVPNVNLAKRESLASKVYDGLQHTYSHIIDIRDADTFTVDCAYVSLTPWRKTSYVTESGVLYVFVEQPLAHPDTVYSKLRLIMHVSGLPDLTFAGPTRPRGTPMNGFDCNEHHFPPSTSELEYQGFSHSLSDQKAPVNIPIVNDVSPANPTEAHKTSIGDPVTSLRQLLKRFMINDVVSWSTNLLMLQPFKLTDAQDDPRIKKTNFVSSDFIDYVSCLYRFRKGGVRVALAGLVDRVSVAHRNLDQLKADNELGLYHSKAHLELTRPSIARQVELDPAKYFRSEGFFAPAYSFVPHDESTQALLQFEIPYYHPYSLMETNRFRAVRTSNPAEPDGMMTIPQSIPNLTTSNVITVWRVDATKSRTVEIYRAAADDFNCGFLLGPPPTLDVDDV